MFRNKKYQNGKSVVTFFEDTIRVFKPRPPNIFFYSGISSSNYSIKIKLNLFLSEFL